MVIFQMILQVILALIFLMSGAGKVKGGTEYEKGFEAYGLPAWFVRVTGIVEILIVILLILGFWFPITLLIGAVLTICVAIGGTLAHIRAKDDFFKMLPIIFVGIFAIIIVIIA
ncbi:DoxX family protein [Brochothrix thermosphacta]|uniref:DoxX family protein n=1 Tax=Brochothrix thermosphacta TaxID=2756 RepID=UPI000D0F972A|nr:DoxX family protein [Brochothrix thermosphacta]SOC31381.1 conserved membrane hypothetical protein [Brochothrix thermosphacta]